MIRALSFDMTGTLAVPHPSVGAVYAGIARRHGLDADATVLDAAFPGAFRGVVAQWPVPYGRDDDDALRFWGKVIEATFSPDERHSLSWELVCDCYDAFAQAARWRVLPDVREALAWARAQALPLAVVSNFDCRLPGLLDALELGPFACVITSAQVGRAKPDPAPLLAACARMLVSPADVLHVGDSDREDGGMCSATGAVYFGVGGGAGFSAADLAGIIASIARQT